VNRFQQGGLSSTVETANQNDWLAGFRRAERDHVATAEGSDVMENQLV
jgi:hypothetical protein